MLNFLDDINTDSNSSITDFDDDIADQVWNEKIRNENNRFARLSEIYEVSDSIKVTTA